MQNPESLFHVPVRLVARIYIFKESSGNYVFFLIFGALVEESLCEEARGRLRPSVEHGHSQSVPFLIGKKRRSGFDSRVPRRVSRMHAGKIYMYISRRYKKRGEETLNFPQSARERN